MLGETVLNDGKGQHCLILVDDQLIVVERASLLRIAVHRIVTFRGGSLEMRHVLCSFIHLAPCDLAQEHPTGVTAGSKLLHLWQRVFMALACLLSKVKAWTE